jgi:hypothetical protein
MKTSELTGLALNWAVATCEGGTGLWFDTVATYWVKLDGKDRALSKGWAQSYTPSTNWAQGGPIIEREWDNIMRRFYLSKSNESGDMWPDYMLNGQPVLIAFMRCYVASKLGDNVDIPKSIPL